ncbi:hypothetical protein CEUSTIGMA_g394.t1 [Chlamydomonas eustigma]|uniref:Uncharacterized protein n=1 Tax=Chlamydomonas eustigma TaxID=1157962 RepID=A0A250WQH0_9CHLO|nr:hypothetical protein CEUSTIGMA_g394.t1 [Chlamydomonas eustigma]|eukprot:GAX72939.1 hypothetical protein CEUSTIGMA_g394.t1 [Chlamydomonas eustigma]
MYLSVEFGYMMHSQSINVNQRLNWHDSIDIRVCTNRACKKAGSQQILKFFEDLSLPSITVSGAGCLGSCGKGPNLLVQKPPLLHHSETRRDQATASETVLICHIATISDAFEVITSVCGMTIAQTDIDAAQFRLQGNELAVGGDLQGAMEMYTRGLNLDPGHGHHLLLCNRSAVLLHLGRKQEALQDALRSLELSPPSFAKAWLRAVDCHYALEQYVAAAALTRLAVQQCPQFKSLPSFVDVREALKKVGHPV